MLDVTIVAGDGTQEVEVPLRAEGVLELVVSGQASSKVGAGELMASRRLGAELPAWARLSSEYAIHEADSSLDPEGLTEVRGLVAGPWDVLVFGDGWATEPVQFNVEPGLRVRVDLKAQPGGAVVFELPPVAGPGCFTLEVRRSGSVASDAWIKASTALFSGPRATAREICLPPGRWQWRATCSLFSDSTSSLRGIPREDGVVDVVVGEAKTIAIGRPKER